MTMMVMTGMVVVVVMIFTVALYDQTD